MNARTVKRPRGVSAGAGLGPRKKPPRRSSRPVKSGGCSMSVPVAVYHALRTAAQLWAAGWTGGAR